MREPWCLHDPSCPFVSEYPLLSVSMTIQNETCFFASADSFFALLFCVYSRAAHTHDSFLSSRFQARLVEPLKHEAMAQSRLVWHISKEGSGMLTAWHLGGPECSPLLPQRQASHFFFETQSILWHCSVTILPQSSTLEFQKWCSSEESRGGMAMATLAQREHNKVKMAASHPSHSGSLFNGASYLQSYISCRGNVWCKFSGSNKRVLRVFEEISTFSALALWVPNVLMGAYIYIYIYIWRPPYLRPTFLMFF